MSSFSGYLDINSFECSNLNTIDLHHFNGVFYGTFPALVHTFRIQDRPFQQDHIRQLIDDSRNARQNCKSLGCISGYYYSPIFSFTAWSFFGASQTLAEKLPQLSATSLVINCIGIIQALKQLHSRSLYHGCLTPYSIILNTNDEPLVGFYGINEVTLNLPTLPDPLSPYIDPRRTADLKSDLFSLRQIIASLVFGRVLQPNEPIDPNSFPDFFRILYQATTIPGITIEMIYISLGQLIVSMGDLPDINIQLLYSYLSNETPLPDIIISIPSAQIGEGQYIQREAETRGIETTESETIEDMKRKVKKEKKKKRKQEEKTDPQFIHTLIDHGDPRTMTQSQYQAIITPLYNPQAPDWEKEEAIRKLQEGEACNNEYAICYLAFQYFRGNYFSQDYEKALYYFLKAAKMGNRSAQLQVFLIMIHNPQYFNPEVAKQIVENPKSRISTLDYALYYKIINDQANFDQQIQILLDKSNTYEKIYEICKMFLDPQVFGVDKQMATRFAQKLQDTNVEGYLTCMELIQNA